MPSDVPPSFSVVTGAGERLTIRPRGADDRVGELRRALGGAARLVVDGVSVPDGRRLVDVPGLRNGATIHLARDRATDSVPPDPAAGDAPQAAHLQPGAEDAGVAAGAPGRVGVAVIAGPACSSWTPLAPGRHGIGRARASRVVVDDPDVEPHHGMLEVADGGAVTFTQLTGRVPVRVAGRPAERVHPVDWGDIVVAGSSVVRVGLRPAPPTVGLGSLDQAADDPWRLVVRRAPSRTPAWTPPVIRVPEPAADHPRPPATGLAGAAIGIAGAIVMAVVLGQPLFAVFALVAAVASLATWVGSVLAAHRRRRQATERARSSRTRFRADLARACADRAEHLRQRHPTISATLDLHDGSLVAGATSMVWGRRPEHGTLDAVVGVGDLTWSLPVDVESPRPLEPELQFAVEGAERLESVPIAASFVEGVALALRGARAAQLAVARSLVIQLASWYGPADWHLAVVTSDPARWRWCHWLPHAATAEGPAIGSVSLVEELLDGDAGIHEPRLLVVVVDDRSALASRTSPLRRLLDRGAAAALVLVGADDTVPTICDRVLEMGATGVAAWHGESPSAGTVQLRFGGVDETTAARVARRLAALVDPERGGGASGDLPVDVRLADVRPTDACDAPADAVTPGVDAAAIVGRWVAAGRDPNPSATIGCSADGFVDVDLVRDGPHGLIAGTTGSGKSELLRTLVVSLAAGLGPDHLTFVLVDYKGGATFDACVDLPHTVGVVTDLDEGLAERALVSLEAELTRRERALREVAADDLADYRSRPGVSPLPRLVVVIDEFAALAKDLPEFLSALVGIAQRGRSLGVHLLLATQRPAGVVSDEIRANTNLRIALRLHDPGDAHDVVGCDLPARFPRRVPGRAALRLGPDELVVFQSARCTAAPRATRRRLSVEREAAPGDPATGEGASAATPATSACSELRMLVDAIGQAARSSGVAPPHRPWQPPLPSVATAAEVAAITAAPSDGLVGESGADRGADVIGLVDDPVQQRRGPLRWDVDAGNLALVGALGAGTTSTLLAVAAAQCRTRPPDRCHVYVVDAAGDAALDPLAGIEHCGGVVRLGERERLARLLRRLVAEIDRRGSEAVGRAERGVRTLLLVDGLGTLRSALAAIDDVALLAALDRVLADGPAVGVVTAFTATGSAVSTAMPAAERWVFHLDDPAAARALCGSGRPVPDRSPGRLRIASSGLEAQVVHLDDPLADLPRRTGSTGPPGIGVLPERVRIADVAASSRRGAADERSARSSDDPASASKSLLVGLVGESLAPATLCLPAGDHVFIGGLARTGRSAALRRIAAAWREATPNGRVVAASACDPLSREDLVGRADEGTDPCPLLVVVDDAERVEDDRGVLREVLDGRHEHVTVAIAARLDAVRSSYGHWTREITRSRCGLIMTAASEIDGDLLGVTLPRRSLPGPRPGLGWLVDGSGHRLVQVALDG